MAARPRIGWFLAAAAAVVVASLVGAGCGATGGGRGSDRPEQAATLLLDFTPNAVHAGIYAAVARDFDGAEGVDLRVRTPGTSTDAVKLLSSGRVRFAVLDIHDLALARERGSDLVGVQAIVQRPLAAVIAAPDVGTPSDLEGRRVGVTGLPSDDAVLDTVVRGAGGDPRRVRRVTIGFNAVAALLSRRVAGATAFWNVEGEALRARRPGTRVFRVDDFGAPPYPELVLVTTRQTLQDEPAVVRATTAALSRGYAEALMDPEFAVEALTGAVKGLDRAQTQRSFEVIAPALSGPRGFGVLDRQRLAAWGRWEARVGITKRPVDPAKAFAGLR
jgi:putative hydroxymethylpyrimidine transport system substrate-binding protein